MLPNMQTCIMVADFQGKLSLDLQHKAAKYLLVDNSEVVL